MSKKFPVLIAAFALLAAVLACSLFTTELSLTNLRMAYDSDGNNPTSVFSPSDVFYIVGDIANAPAGTYIDAKWIATQVEGSDPGKIIYEHTMNDFTDNSFSGTIYFQLSNDDPWPAGQYEVDVYLNGTFVQSVPFSVR